MRKTRKDCVELCQSYDSTLYLGYYIYLVQKIKKDKIDWRLVFQLAFEDSEKTAAGYKTKNYFDIRDEESWKEYVESIDKTVKYEFEPRQMVEICQDQPDFCRASASYPHVGFRGMIVTGDKYETYKVPEGKVAVRFSSKLMGYLDYNERPFTVYYCQKWALKPSPKKKG